LAHGAFVAVAFVAGVPVVAFSVSFLLPWLSGLALFVVLNVVGMFLYKHESRLPGKLSRLLALLADKFPPISAWARVEDVRMANAALVNDFNLTLREYKLGHLTREDQEDLADRGRPLSVREIARRTKDRVSGNLSPEALELLQRERSKSPTLNLWQSHKETVVEELAPILHRSERMPDPGPGYRFTREDVSELLRGLREFDVDFVAEELRILGDLGQRLRRYARFVRDQGLTEEEPELQVAKAVCEHAGLGLPADRPTLFRLERAETALRLLDLVDRFVKEDALRAVHHGIFLAERDAGGDLLKEQCAVVFRWGKEPDPVEILHAYLWKKDRRGVAGVTLVELDRDWRRWSNRARSLLGDGDFGGELNVIRDRLDAGRWPIRRVDLRGRPTFPLPAQVTVPTHPIVHDLLPRREEVPPRHDEVRDLDAYLITFDERTGPVADLVDSLKEKRPRGRQTYRFGPYTRNTRLGLLPPNVPFHEFVEQFFADLDGVLREYAPDPPYPKPAGALRVVEGGKRKIELRHDEPCEDADGKKMKVDFDITKHPGAGEGWLSGKTRIDSQRASVTYVPPPGPLAEAMVVSFEYESRCGRTTRKQPPVTLFVEPRGRQQPLDRIEVTVNRIDLEHCRELWFGDDALGPSIRPPSIYDVWNAIEGQLGPDETPLVKDVFDRIAGGTSGLAVRD
jgi:hypothetical protein